MAVTTTTRFDPTRIRRAQSAQKYAITVLAGGPSGEREVSLQSGRCVAVALESLGHQVYLQDVGPENLQALARNVDCVFVALHGRFGEDGQVQEILERRRLAYTGSTPETCRAAMNKYLAKKKFEMLGLPTPHYAVVTPENLGEALTEWNLPVVVKPVKEGSSLNCFIVREASRLRPSVQALLEGYGDCLIEEYVPGLELTVGILDDQPLPAIEIRTRRDFYDYQAKYVDDDTEYRFDIDLPGDLLEQIARMSLEAHEGLGCRDFSRVDWRVDPERMQPYLLEVNVIPGMTSHSLLPKAAARAGLSWPQVCGHLVASAVRRRPSR